MNGFISLRLLRAAIYSLCILGLSASSSSAQLFENLKALSPRYPVGDPSLTNALRGPKGIAGADFNGDGLADFAVSDKNGSVTVYISRGTNGFEAPLYLQTGDTELRGIGAADVNGDGRPDILTAAPFEGRVHVFLNQGNGEFKDQSFSSWTGARDLIVGDFDSDGKPDLVLAGPNVGLRQYQGLGDGRFASVTSFPELDSTQCGDNNDFPQPAYFLQRFRLPGTPGDSIVAAHGEGCDHLWVFTPSSNGVLSIRGELKNIDVNAVAVGHVFKPTTNGFPDLVTSSLDQGYLEIRKFDPSLGTFETNATVRLPVEGGPRSIRLVDWDHDGWNDLVVVLRYFDKVTLFNNHSGVLKSGPSFTVGRLPREIEVADFTGDGNPDLAVVNRYSLDVTILPGFEGASTFAALDQVYPVDGVVSGLDVRDYNKDGFADVVQLHIASAEMSVRLSDGHGLLGEPKFYPLGIKPSAQTVTDVNNDGKPDIVAVDLHGSISVRLGLGDGTFGSEQVYMLPPNLRGGLFALVAGDFDNDGLIDLAAGFVDCRIVFLKGDGTGQFKIVADYDHPLTFSYEARSMAVADFDKDGDLDIVGAGLDGRVSIIENLGDLLTAKRIKIHTFESPNLHEIRSVQVLDENRDGFWDLFVSGPSGSALFLGGPELSFTLKEASSFDAHGGGNSSAQADFDGDGNLDLVVANADSNTLSVFVRKNEASPWESALLVSVPSASFIATADLDGDGKPDLVGTGQVLWTALSSRRSKVVATQIEGENHSMIPHLVINEILAGNQSFAVEADGGRFSDWLEIFNGGAEQISLAGWSLTLVRTNGVPVATTNRYDFPATAALASRDRLLLVAADKKRTVLHTGFPLPVEGASLELVNPKGEVVDRVDYPSQQVDKSYSRFRDGGAGWVFNPYPSPNRANQDNGTLEPEVTFGGVDPETLVPGARLRFRARGRDDLGITTMAIFWHRIDVPDPVEHRVILFDDGMHDDGATQDGLFVGTFEKGFPAGARIQFYLAASDLTDKVIYLPNKPERLLSKFDPSIFSLAIGASVPTLELSEIVSDNRSGLKDDQGGHPDWVEVRNYGLRPLDLDTVRLVHGFLEGGEHYSFPKGTVIQPGEHLIIYCDGQTKQSVWHAPFSLTSKGDSLFLVSNLPSGEIVMVDGVRFGALPQDHAWARLGIRGRWGDRPPTPRADNWAGLWIGLVDGQVELAVQTQAGVNYVLESATTPRPDSWQIVQNIAGDGSQRLLSGSGVGTEARFYRLRSP